jgi:hypothetical protein
VAHHHRHKQSQPRVDGPYHYYRYRHCHCHGAIPHSYTLRYQCSAGQQGLAKVGYDRVLQTHAAERKMDKVEQLAKLGLTLLNLLRESFVTSAEGGVHGGAIERDAQM